MIEYPKKILRATVLPTILLLILNIIVFGFWALKDFFIVATLETSLMFAAGYAAVKNNNLNSEEGALTGAVTGFFSALIVLIILLVPAIKSPNSLEIVQ